MRRLKREWIVGAALLPLTILLWPRDIDTTSDQKKVSQKEKRRTLTNLSHRARTPQISLADFARSTESLNDEQLWNEIEDTWNRLSTDPYDPAVPRLTMLLREFGKRHGQEALSLLDQLDVREDQIQTGQVVQARLTIMCGWSTTDPTSAGLALLIKDPQHPLTSINSRFPHRSLAMDRAGREIFKRWAEEDIEGAKAKLYEARADPNFWHPQFRYTLTDAIRDEPHPLNIVITESRIEMPVFTKAKVSTDAEIDLTYAPEIVEFEGFINYGTPIIWPKDLPGKKALSLEAWAGKNPELARGMLEVAPGLLTAGYWDSLKGISRSDPDYLGLIEIVPEENRKRAMIGLLAQAKFHPEESVWPIDGEANTWTLTQKERQAALSKAIEFGPFSEENREKLATAFQTLLTK